MRFTHIYTRRSRPGKIGAVTTARGRDHHGRLGFSFWGFPRSFQSGSCSPRAQLMKPSMSALGALGMASSVSKISLRSELGSWVRGLRVGGGNEGAMSGVECSGRVCMRD